MLQEGHHALINEIVEELEMLCDGAMDDFWTEIEKINMTEEQHNEFTKELLNAIEHIFTKTPE